MTRAKRILDLGGATLGILLLAPVVLAVAILIKLDDGGPVFFRQERVGRHGVRFRMWKFRTMVVDAQRRGLPLTVGADARITRVGRWMRRHKVDELPQLLNVLAGDMSLVGPRPEVPRYVALYSPEQQRVLALQPGMTDPAATAFLDESDILGRAGDPERLYIDEIMPAKLRLNLEYARRATLSSDIQVILRTIGLIGAQRSKGPRVLA